MTPTLREQFERLALRLAELDATLADAQIAADIKRWRLLSREQAAASDIVGRFRRYQQRESDLAAAREMQADPEMAEMAREDLLSAERDALVKRHGFRSYGQHE